MAEYIDREALPLKEWTKTAQMFSDDIVCAAETDFLENIAESENKTLFEIIEAIKSAPTADVTEVKHGKWKKIQNYALCSNCKHEVNWGCKDFLSLYCPNCGAKMDK